MNIKKIAISAAAGALMLSMAMPALANHGNWNGGKGGKLDIKIDNKADVSNLVFTKANTGDNSIGGKVVFGGKINTGDAGAGSYVTNVVNSNEVDLCGCLTDKKGDVKVGIKNDAYVNNVVFTKANTGDNSIGGKIVLGGKINTGDAGAEGVVTNVVNTNVLN